MVVACSLLLVGFFASVRWVREWKRFSKKKQQLKKIPGVVLNEFHFIFFLLLAFHWLLFLVGNRRPTLKNKSNLTLKKADGVRITV